MHALQQTYIPCTPRHSLTLLTPFHTSRLELLHELLPPERLFVENVRQIRHQNPTPSHRSKLLDRVVQVAFPHTHRCGKQALAFDARGVNGRDRRTLQAADALGDQKRRELRLRVRPCKRKRKQTRTRVSLRSLPLSESTHDLSSPALPTPSLYLSHTQTHTRSLLIAFVCPFFRASVCVCMWVGACACMPMRLRAWSLVWLLTACWM